VAQKMVAQAPGRVRKVSLVNAHAGLRISGMVVTSLGFIGCVLGMWTLCSPSMAHRDMNVAWILHGFETNMTKEEKHETVRKWEATCKIGPDAVQWIRRRLGDIFLSIAYLTHTLWAGEVAILREFGATNR